MHFRLNYSTTQWNLSMTEQDFQFFKELVEAPSPSGFEQPAQRVIRRALDHETFSFEGKHYTFPAKGTADPFQNPEIDERPPCLAI